MQNRIFKNFYSIITYGFLVKEIFSIIGELVTTQLSPILGNHILIITSIVITMLGPITLLWILRNENISPYIYIPANSAVGLIKAIAIIFTILAKIDSDQERTNAFTALEASSIFTSMTPFFMHKVSALKTAIGIGAVTIFFSFATYPKEPEQPTTDEARFISTWKSSFMNLVSKNQIYSTSAYFLGYLASCTNSLLAQATIQEHSSMDYTSMSIIISFTALTKLVTKTIVMPIIFKKMKKTDYVICTAILGITHATLIALQPNNITPTYISFILAAIASSLNTAIISEISQNTDQRGQPPKHKD
jgi:uncharacterized membrane protein YeaQ/YmgE (transglycosylase-associated protein family)